MSAEPPSSDRPTGPPSGPLSEDSGGSGDPGRTSSRPPPPSSSGPPQQPPPAGPPPSGPPPEGGAGRGPSGSGSGGHWWRSVPRVAAVAAVLAAAVVVAVVLSRPGGGGSEGGGEIFLQPAGGSGPDPFTASTAKGGSAPPVTPSPTAMPPSSNTVRGVDGATPGLYGGTRDVTSCDVEKQIGALRADPAKNKAFASVALVAPSGVPARLRSLTPLQLRMDTRVTNHGYRDGAATRYQAVLQAGTAVLVDDRGEPRVRCACGNPLTPPVAQHGTPRRTGDPWPSYDPSNVVAVSPARHPVKSFVVYDAEHGTWFTRHRGDTGGKDHETAPPAGRPTPSPGVTTPSSPASPGEETSPPPADDTPAPEPPASRPASPAPPTTDQQTTDQQTTAPPTTEPPPEDSPSGSAPAPGTPPQSGPGEQQPGDTPPAT